MSGWFSARSPAAPGRDFVIGCLSGCGFVDQWIGAGVALELLAVTFAQQVAPLKNLQVWRFSLYYFFVFVFGAFADLALWLHHYLIDVYGIDARFAGMAAATFSLSASLFRAYGGVLSDKFGARSVMYWTFGFSLLFLFMLSYPPTDYIT